MKSFRGIYFVGLLSMAYSLPTIKYAVTTGQLWYGVFALLPLIGAVGLFLRRSWARFPIYAFSVCVVPTWVAYTMWFLAKKGWPYYSTILESVLGLVPGLLLCAGRALGSWIVHQGFHRAGDIRPCFSPGDTACCSTGSCLPCSPCTKLNTLA